MCIHICPWDLYWEKQDGKTAGSNKNESPGTEMLYGPSTTNARDLSHARFFNVCQVPSTFYVMHVMNFTTLCRFSAGITENPRGAWVHSYTKPIIQQHTTHRDRAALIEYPY